MTGTPVKIDWNSSHSILEVDICWNPNLFMTWHFVDQMRLWYKTRGKKISFTPILVGNSDPESKDWNSSYCTCKAAPGDLPASHTCAEHGSVAHTVLEGTGSKWSLMLKCFDGFNVARECFISSTWISVNEIILD